MQIDVFKDCRFIFLHIKKHVRSENKKMCYLAALFLPNGHFSKITNSSLAKKNRPDSQFIFTFPLVLSHKVQHIQKLQNSKDKKKMVRASLSGSLPLTRLILRLVRKSNSVIQWFKTCNYNTPLSHFSFMH